MSLFAGVVRAMRSGAGRRLALSAVTATVLAGNAAAQTQTPAAQAPSPGQAAVRKTFEDWQLRCETPAGAKAEQCALVQNVAAEDRPNLTLVVIVLKTADNRGYLLRVVAPLGVLLPSGLGLKIDQTDIGRASFVRCLTAGCVAEVVMDDGLIKSLRNGSQATFIIFQTPEEGVGIPVSMKGFGPGFDALK
jgi:invasion protein IalB